MTILIPKAVAGLGSRVGAVLSPYTGMKLRYASDHSGAHQASSSSSDEKVPVDVIPSGKEIHNSHNKSKSMEEQDAELRSKLENISGGGGEAGLELEDGKPVAMKRSVKENMFRLI